MQFRCNTYIKIISFGGLAALILVAALFLTSRRQSISKTSPVSNDPPAKKFSNMLGQLNQQFMFYYDLKAMDRGLEYKDRKLSLPVEHAFAEIIQTRDFKQLLKDPYIQSLWRGNHFIDPWGRPLRWVTFMKPLITVRLVDGKYQKQDWKNETVQVYSVGPNGMSEPDPHELIAR